MTGDFTYHNPTKLHFGENAMDALADELNGYGPVVMFSYGGGYKKLSREEVMAILRESL